MTRLLRSIAFVLIASLFAASASAQSASNTDAETFFDFQVDQAVKVRVVQRPAYPERLRTANIDGQVLVQFVVDERGSAEMNTFKVIKTSSPEFADAVRRAISNTAYSPAEVRGRHVRQLVQQPFTFSAH